LKNLLTFERPTQTEIQLGRRRQFEVPSKTQDTTIDHELLETEDERIATTTPTQLDYTIEINSSCHYSP